MTTAIRGTSDSSLEQIICALAGYEGQHPRAQIEAYRYGCFSAAIRVRVVDPDFAGISRADRHDILWSFLEQLPEDVLSEMSLLIPVTPDEMPKSIASIEFDNPVPSML